MPRGVKAKGVLPEKLTVELVQGEGFVRLREAARLGGLHPAIVEMG